MKITVHGGKTIVVDGQVLLAPAVGVHLPPGARWKVIECGTPPEVVYLIERPGLRLGYRPRGDEADVWVIP